MSTSNPLVLAIDQGTTGSTALLLDPSLRVLATHNVEFPNHYPQPGHVEHDPEEIWASVGQAVEGAVQRAGVDAGQIAAIGITNQRETSLFWDRKTGQALHRALVWQDRRTADRCQALKDAGKESFVKRRTGLVLDPYFSGTKAAWLLDNVPGARDAANRGDALFGTIDTYLTWRLCGAHVTDPSNASRTLFMDLDTLDWNDELLELLNVPRACLPRVGQSSEIYGHTQGVGFLPDGIPVCGLIGDQQGALFGQACFTQGMAKCTYGTGAFVLLNTGAEKVYSDNGMLTTVAWKLGGQHSYALEGSAFIAGAAVQWLRDGLGIIKSASEIEALAASVPHSDGVTFVPALAGLGAPHWRPGARGLLSGITGGTTRAHIARAVLDGVALQIGDILQAMSMDLGGPLTELRVDGGAAKNNLLMQLQADVLGVRCVRPAQLETTALGSAFLAGIAAGIWSSAEEVSAAWREDRTFTSQVNKDELHALRARWKAAVERA
ncbi:MAG: glycerol kinase GlpK [Deltaproteobacteria bacterium]|nr:glycerol kinase GlpK [Deltaproteobacteria bacterium]MBK9365489.1 glycerol kinase GlpK [Deltaproteobacteria bacterium]MBK9646365.1 glycerol kinase GlpK [Deltaproteobacteria bacterium]